MKDPKREKQISDIVREEYADAVINHGHFHSAHEGYALMLEEVQEAQDEKQAVDENVEMLWQGIKQDAVEMQKLLEIKRHAESLVYEAIQIAAMCIKFMELQEVNEQEQEDLLADLHKPLRYNVGDRVVIRSWESMAEEYGLVGTSTIKGIGFYKAMSYLCENSFLIENIYQNNYTFEEILSKGYAFTDKMINHEATEKLRKESE